MKMITASKNKIFLLTVAVAGYLTGCCSTNHVADPKDITLSNALVSVA